MRKGSFVFRYDGNGCLSSQFIHDQKGPFVETCKRLDAEDVNDPFLGNFTSVWLEENNAIEYANLVITKHINNPMIYNLVWLDNSVKKFEGFAMKYGELLIGSYWQP